MMLRPPTEKRTPRSYVKVSPPVPRDGAIVSGPPPLGRLVARSEVHAKLSAIVHQRWIERALQVGREPLECDRLPLRPRLAVVRGEGRGDAIKVGGVVTVGIEVLERDEDLVAAREATPRRAGTCSAARRHPPGDFLGPTYTR